MGFLVWSGLAGAAVLIYAAAVLRRALDKPQGSRTTARLAGRLETGALMFLEHGFTRVLGIGVMLFALSVAAEMFMPELQVKMQTGLAVLVGALAGMLSCLAGLLVAVRLDVRAGYSLQTRGRKTAVEIIDGGSLAVGLIVIGITVVGLVLAARFVSGAPLSLAGYALGVSLTALLARTGGGVFTHAMQAADGSALGSNAEVSIPKGVLPLAGRLGNVLARVGGLGLDLMESQMAALIASVMVGLLIYRQSGTNAPEYVRALPFWILALGMLSTIVGVHCTRSAALRSSWNPPLRGHFFSLFVFVAGICLYGRYQGSGFFLRGVSYGAMEPIWACIIGVAAVTVVRIVSRVPKGTAGELMSDTANMVLCVLLLALTVFLSHHFAGLYGMCVASLGMMTATGMVISEGVCPPVTDNAWSVFRAVNAGPQSDDEMSGMEREFRRSPGPEGSIASVCGTFSAAALMAAFMISINSLAFRIGDPLMLAGIIAGAVLPSLFRALLLGASGKCALAASREACRQMEAETAKEKDEKRGSRIDPMACIDLAVRSSVNSALLMGLLAVALPVAAGLLAGAQGLVGLLVGTMAGSVALGFRSSGPVKNARAGADNLASCGESPADTDALDQPVKSLLKLMCVTALVFTPLFVWIGR